MTRKEKEIIYWTIAVAVGVFAYVLNGLKKIG